MPKVKPIPQGFHSLTPHLTMKGAKNAIEFYKKAFGAQELTCMLTADGKVMNAQLKIGDSMLMVVDDMWNQSPESLGGSPVAIHLYVEDVDAVFNRAVQAGAAVVMPPDNMFWGDRFAVITDPFGHRWDIATHIEDLSPQEIEKGKEKFTAQMCPANK